MAAPIVWAPGTFWLWFFLQENHAHKIPVLGGGGWILGGRGEVPILF